MWYSFKKISILAFGFCAVAFVLDACKKVEEDYIGPKLIRASKDFKVLDDFALTTSSEGISYPDKDSTRFTAEFSEVVTWTIRMQGLTSGAVREITHVSSSIDTFWLGETNQKIDALELFTTEKVKTELIVLGATVNFAEYELNVVRPHEYNQVYLQADFETNTPFQSWEQPTVEAGSPDVVSIIADSILDTPQGEKYVKITGEDKDNSYWVGSLNQTFVSPGRGKNILASDIWFNMYVYGNGSGNNTKIAIEFSESDKDHWVLQIVPDWTGWKLVTAKYVDLTLPTGYTANTNDVKESKKLNRIQIGASSDPSGGKVQMIFDYPCFTLGGPLLNEE